MGSIRHCHKNQAPLDASQEPQIPVGIVDFPDFVRSDIDKEGFTMRQRQTTKYGIVIRTEADRELAEVKEIHQHLTVALKWAGRKGFTTISAELRRCRDFTRATEKPVIFPVRHSTADRQFSARPNVNN
jgi:hypothetical protein